MHTEEKMRNINTEQRTRKEEEKNTKRERRKKGTLFLLCYKRKGIKREYIGKRHEQMST